ncbi:stage III sporulation protein AF [Anaerotignum sp.]|uniref:stage III sporulation protein AF n=1 Tax=Anaerotignum sp. TaxID=2039241 RepID=UPI0027150FE5|nr:stage III sporulation protein AF [Anaerotignum sp.]
MMAALSAYIKTITALTIFSALACMLMPDGSFRKYVELVLGVLVLTAVLNPFLRIFGTDKGYMELGLLQNQARMEKYFLSSEEYEEIEQQRVTAAYGQVLEDRVKEDLAQKYLDIEWVNITFCQDIDDEDYGMIDSIVIGCADEDAGKIQTYAAKRYGLPEEAVSVEK